MDSCFARSTDCYGNLFHRETNPTKGGQIQYVVCIPLHDRLFNSNRHRIRHRNVHCRRFRSELASDLSFDIRINLIFTIGQRKTYS